MTHRVIPVCLRFILFRINSLEEDKAVVIQDESYAQQKREARPKSFSSFKDIGVTIDCYVATPFLFSQARKVVTCPRREGEIKTFRRQDTERRTSPLQGNEAKRLTSRRLDRDRKTFPLREGVAKTWMSPHQGSEARTWTCRLREKYKTFPLQESEAASKTFLRRESATKTSRHRASENAATFPRLESRKNENLRPRERRHMASFLVCHSCSELLLFLTVRH